MRFVSARQRGITVLETIIYIAILAIVSTVVLQTSASIVRTHRLVKLKQSLEASGSIAMERILREVRSATSVDIMSSTLGSSPGVLALTGTRDDGTTYNLVFDVADGALRLAEDGGTPGNLTEPFVTVDSIIFRYLANSTSEGVRVELSLTASSPADSRTLDLFGFAVLRNSY